MLVRISQRLIRRPAGDPAVVVRDAWARLTAVRPTVGDWTVAGAWGISNWVLDCACCSALPCAAPTGSAPGPT